MRINPNGLTPTLVDGDFVLWESNAIMQYLAAQKPGNDLWPEDDEKRADITRWQCWDLAHWAPACATQLYEKIVKEVLGLGEPDMKEVKKGEEKFHCFAAVLDGS